MRDETANEIDNEDPVIQTQTQSTIVVAGN